MKALPSNLHIVYGKKRMRPKAKVRAIIPHAEWLDDPDLWNESGFVTETSEHLFKVYGNTCAIDRHLIGTLASEISLYVKCLVAIKKEEVVVEFNNGKTVGANPYVSIKNDAITKIVMLMNQLGMTPRDRLKNKVSEPTAEDEAIAELMLGPDAYR